MNGTTQSSSSQFLPVFLRLPTGPRRDLWPGSNLSYWKLRSLITPVTWNNYAPPVRAYNLCKAGATRGTVLIEHSDLLQWWHRELQRNNPSLGPLLLPSPQLPPVLTIPPSGEQCPYTQLKHTVMYELSLPQSPYGQTLIYVTRYRLPGRSIHPIAMQTESLLHYIRSCPPPRSADRQAED